MPVLTRDGILGLAKLGLREVELDDGQTVYVRGLSLREYDGFEVAVDGGRRAGRHNVRAELLVRTVCDAEGGRLFSDGDVELVAELAQTVLEPAFRVAAELSGLAETSGKNSPSGPDGGSPSGSPTDSGAPLTNSSTP